MSQVDENGFLFGRIEVWTEQHRNANQPLLALAHSLNRECHKFLDGRSVSTSDPKQLTSTVLFARLMELYQAVLLVNDRGSRAAVRILFRAFLEAFFHFAAISKDSTYLNEYLDQFQLERKSLINRIRNTGDPALENLRKPISETLISELENIDTRKVNIEEVARRGGCHNIYVTAYALLSRSVHSSAADLEAHLALDEKKESIVGFRYGPTNEETTRTIGLAGVTLTEALREISNDFSEDRVALCETFIDSFKALLEAPAG
ncbi:DUF5677 domain-containing protein [Rhodoferax sp. BAB1]|uniref:DUF5677 domain-containing protein n=1 Tax=Rhodoferax sp. BAB1 TaxID=2741720 RepID=UPI0015751FB2|nr:DUF5677 domain-containing protein [Rhodoferax sp. BAB1]QKO23545.1 hypothetical protein HTY51_17410 [Rhodoferax sp. BAB1]